MKQRLLVAALGVPLLLAILLLAPVWATALLAALLSAVGCYELMRAAGGTEWKLLAAMPAFAFALALAWADVWELGEAAAPAAFIAVVYALASAVVTHGRAHRLSFATVMAGIFSAVLLPAATSARQTRSCWPRSTPSASVLQRSRMFRPTWCSATLPSAKWSRASP